MIDPGIQGIPVSNKDKKSHFAYSSSLGGRIAKIHSTLTTSRTQVARIKNCRSVRLIYQNRLKNIMH
jgi:hypothetical protein